MRGSDQSDDATPSAGPKRLWEWIKTAVFGGDPPRIFIPDNDPQGPATEAVVTHVLARPDSIRQRAQSAAGIATAVAAALALAVAGQLLGNNEEDWRDETIVAVVAALVGWLVTVWSYVHVVTLGQRKPGPNEGDVHDLIHLYEVYSNQLRTWLRRAALCSALALPATAIAVTLVVSERLHDDVDTRSLVLNARGSAAVAALCHWMVPPYAQPHVVEAELAANDLSKQMVEARITAGRGTGKCRGGNLMVRLPRGVILATRNR